MIPWLVSAASLLAVWLNIHRRRACFAIWAGTNASWCLIDLYHGIPAQAALQLLYLALSLYGLGKWRARGAQDISTEDRHGAEASP